jgi:hypothetical protein
MSIISDNVPQRNTEFDNLHNPSRRRLLCDHSGQGCQIRFLGKHSSTVLLEFDDGILIKTNLKGLRKISRAHQKGY